MPEIGKSNLSDLSDKSNTGYPPPAPRHPVPEHKNSRPTSYLLLVYSSWKRFNEMQSKPFRTDKVDLT